MPACHKSAAVENKIAARPVLTCDESAGVIPEAVLSGNAARTEEMDSVKYQGITPGIRQSGEK